MSVQPAGAAAPLEVRKRSGRVVEFKQQKITQAVLLCLVNDCGKKNDEATRRLAAKVTARVEKLLKHTATPVSVEAIQNFVEEALFAVGEGDAARQYILFRDQRRKLREATEAAGITEATIDPIREESKLFALTGKSDLQRFQHYDKYARFNDDARRRETYPESATRVLGFVQSHLLKHDMLALTDAEYNMLYAAIVEERATPSMRLMQMAGPAAMRCNVGIYNCSFSGIKDVEYVAENLYNSMAGSGCGFSCESEFVEQLPRVQRRRKAKAAKYTMEDNTESWCDSVKTLAYALYDGHDLDIDYSPIRDEGTRLKTKGGTASGPKPLMDLHTAMRRIFWSREGKRLRDIDVHDWMCYVGQVGQMGGVRRAALISLSDLKSQLMREAKFGAFWNDPLRVQRTMSNNSATYDEKPTSEVFLAEWLSLVVSKSGERGIFNRGSLARQMPERRVKMYGEDAFREILWGCNPCVPADTWVMTADGPQQVKDLIDKPFTAVVDGLHRECETGFFKTRDAADLLEVRLANGMAVRATDNHKILVVTHQTQKVQRTEWVEAGKLKPGMQVVLHNHRDPSGHGWAGAGTVDEGWLLGNLFGDGTLFPSKRQAFLDYWGESSATTVAKAVKLIHETVGGRSDLRGHTTAGGKSRVGSVNLYALGESRGVIADDRKELTDDVERTSSAFHAGFLRGWFDADGSVQGEQAKGVSVRLASNDLPALHRAQRMLARLGVIATIYPFRRPAGERLLPDGNGGVAVYECKADHELIVACDNLRVFADRVGFSEPEKVAALGLALANYRRKLNRERFVSEVHSVTPAGREAVYDCTVAEKGVHAFDANGIYVHNCGEIFLHPDGQFCNLSIGIVRPDDTEETLLAKMELAAVFGTLQSTMTDFNYLRPRWAENCNRERLLGVDLLGALDCPLLREGNPDRDNLLGRLKQRAVETNRKWARRLGIPASNAVTCIKPGGNSGARYGVGQSMSGWLASHMIRNVEVGNINPMCRFLKDQGVPNEISYRDPNTTVFSFPLKAPDKAMVVSDLVTDASGKVVATKPRRTAIDQLNDWLAFKKHFTEHNPSVTVYVTDEEWPEVGAWVYRNWDDVGGLAFLPLDGGVYPQAPFTPVTPEAFEAFAAKFPRIEWEKLPRYERGVDHTNVRKEMACTGDKCTL